MPLASLPSALPVRSCPCAASLTPNGAGRNLWMTRKRLRRTAVSVGAHWIICPVEEASQQGNATPARHRGAARERGEQRAPGPRAANRAKTGQTRESDDQRLISQLQPITASQSRRYKRSVHSLLQLAARPEDDRPPTVDWQHFGIASGDKLLGVGASVW